MKAIRNIIAILVTATVVNKAWAQGAEEDEVEGTMLLECPILECLYDLEPGVCYEHDGAVPT